ncbi:MAG: M1 family aminopeptidase, partial [Bdellovibrionota bacterium]
GIKRAAEWNQIPVEYYGPTDDMDRLSYSLRKTPDMLTYLSDLTGFRYPYEKYAQVVVPQYQWGGMEHTTATTLTDRTVHSANEEPEFDSEALVAHELAHQWFGDLVTCQSWDHLWLNEGFATYFEMAWGKHAKGEDHYLEELSGYAEWYFWEATVNGGKSERPVVFPYQVHTADYFFDSHAYAKGGWILHMLRNLLGDEVFYAGIRKYTYAMQGKLAVTEDLKRALESASGRDLDWFFDQWVYKPGFPSFEVTWQTDPEGGMVTLNVKQVQDPTLPGGVAGLTPYFRGPIQIELDGKMHEIALAGLAVERFQIMIGSNATKVRYVQFNSENGWLAQVKNQQSFEAWAAMLVSSPDLTARVQAAQELAGYTLAEDAGADVLAELRARKISVLEKCATADPKPWVRESCLDGMKAVLKAAIHQLELPSTSPLSPALEQLQAAIDVASTTLATLAKDDGAVRIRASAINGLWMLPAAKALPVIRERIQNEKSFGNVKRAIGTLGSIQSPEVYDLAMAQLGRESFQDSAKSGVFIALRQIRDLRSLPVAEEYALARHSEPLRISAFGLLGSLGKKFPVEAGERALAVLVPPLKEGTAPYRIKRGLIQALGVLGDPSVLPLLHDIAANDPVGRVREEAVQAIEAIEDAQD